MVDPPHLGVSCRIPDLQRCCLHGILVQSCLTVIWWLQRFSRQPGWGAAAVGLGVLLHA